MPIQLEKFETGLWEKGTSYKYFVPSPIVFYVLYVILLTSLIGCVSSSKKTELTFYSWHEGYFDIHHINTGRGNAIFFIFPDGTNLLYDAGAKLHTGKEHPNWKEHLADIHPNDSRSGGAWMAHYIDQVLPAQQERRIDYAVISHFHIDHFGELDTEKTPYASRREYQLTGITEVGYHIPFGKILDRGYPEYDYPVDLRTFYSTVTPQPSFANYLKFLTYERAHSQLKCEKVIVGSKEQIKLLYYPDKFTNFTVRNLKSNQYYWSGVNNNTFAYEFPEPLYNKEKNTFNENPLSIALKFSYGEFDYVTAGDIAGINGFPNFDMETSLAKIVGQTEVMTLNHHGAHDSSNSDYLKTLSPKLIVHQALHGHHYYKPVIKRIDSLTTAKVLTMNADDKVKEEIGALYNKVFLNEEGHIVIRVKPGGQSFEALILDDNSENMPILKRIGPFDSH